MAQSEIAELAATIGELDEALTAAENTVGLDVEDRSEGGDLAQLQDRATVLGLDITWTA